MEKKDIVQARRMILDNLGKKVQFKANKGRNKYETAVGIIQECYPNIFTICIDSGERTTKRYVSFSYVDLLANDVQLKLCK